MKDRKYILMQMAHSTEFKSNLSFWNYLWPKGNAYDFVVPIIFAKQITFLDILFAKCFLYELSAHVYLTRSEKGLFLRGRIPRKVGPSFQNRPKLIKETKCNFERVQKMPTFIVLQKKRKSPICLKFLHGLSVSESIYYRNQTSCIYAFVVFRRYCLVA